jgi:glucosamine--fructose-6-phosphate aminotransferase (isomerizing)
VRHRWLRRKTKGGLHHSRRSEAAGVPGIRFRRRLRAAGGRLDVAKKAGRVENLAREAAGHSFTGTTGIGHTRWATHGGVSDANAHPHLSSDGKFALIHNGVIENYAQMKAFLKTKGFTFQSETDTEVLCNLIAYHYAKEPAAQDGDSRFVASVRKTLRHVEGTYGIAALCVDYPGEIVAARKASPLILGVGDHEFILASDASALISRTQNVVYLKDGEIVHLTPAEFAITTLDQADVSPVVDKITWQISDAERGDYAHFMEKEIFEQPTALENTMRALRRGREHRQFRRAERGRGRVPPDRPVSLLRVRNRLARVPRCRTPDRALRARSRRGRLRF